MITARAGHDATAPCNMTTGISETERYHNRVKTFDTWPSWAEVQPEALARAGFFYRKERDLVKCEYCGGKFYNWKEGDDPLVQHQLYYPKCSYVVRLSSLSGTGHAHTDPPPPLSATSAWRAPRRHGGEVRASVAVAASPGVAPPAKQGNGTSGLGGDEEAETQRGVPPASMYETDIRTTKAGRKTSKENRGRVTSAKWVRSRMDLPFVQLVMAKGYRRSDVEQVLLASWEGSRDVKNAVSLVRQIYELEDREERDPEAARVALATEARATGWEGGAGDEPASGGDNWAVTELEAGYDDPGRDLRYQRLPPSQQQQVKAQLAQKPVRPRIAAQGASAPPEGPQTTAPAPTAPAAGSRVQEDAVKVRANSICIVCKTTLQGCLFLPCECVCTCPKCGNAAVDCPECGREIEHRVRVYLG